MWIGNLYHATRIIKINSQLSAYIIYLPKDELLH